MDANAVAWNFNRFLYLMNHTGELPSDGRAVKVHSLYEFNPGFYSGTPIFDTIVASDTDTVVFTLTAPYAPILDAMCYISCGILSPASTRNNTLIDLATGDIVGTGPYMYDYYFTDKEVRFSKFDDYWATNAPYNLEEEVMFDAMVYSIIDDPSALNYALIAGDIDVLLEPMTELLPTFRTNPWITVYEADQPGLLYQYLCFNNMQINLTWRKAMSYAINYSYIIEVVLEGRAHRAYSAISPSYGDGFNHWLRDSDRSIDPTNGSAVYNLTIARQTILTGLGGDARIIGLTASSNASDPDWAALGNSTVNCLAYYNYSYNKDDWFSSYMYSFLSEWFADIGIYLEDGGSDWGYFLLRAYGYIPGGYDQLQVFFSSEESLHLGGYRWWSYAPPTTKHPDYLDPFNILDPLFSNVSQSNACQINDPWVQGFLSLALQTTDDKTRNQIYRDLQWRLFAKLFVHAPVYHTFVTSVHAANLYDVAYNVMGRWWALLVKRNFTWYPII